MIVVSIPFHLKVVSFKLNMPLNLLRLVNGISLSPPSPLSLSYSLTHSLSLSLSHTPYLYSVYLFVCLSVYFSIYLVYLDEDVIYISVPCLSYFFDICCIVLTTFTHSYIPHHLLTLSHSLSFSLPTARYHQSRYSNI
jgi:hypothetical protein